MDATVGVPREVENETQTAQDNGVMKHRSNQKRKRKETGTKLSRKMDRGNGNPGHKKARINEKGRSIEGSKRLKKYTGGLPHKSSIARKHETASQGFNKRTENTMTKEVDNAACTEKNGVVAQQPNQKRKRTEEMGDQWPRKRGSPNGSCVTKKKSKPEEARSIEGCKRAERQRTVLVNKARMAIVQEAEPLATKRKNEDTQVDVQWQRKKPKCGRTTARQNGTARVVVHKLASKVISRVK
jgi:hypothetical protein